MLRQSTQQALAMVSASRVVSSIAHPWVMVGSLISVGKVLKEPPSNIILPAFAGAVP